MGIVSEDIGQKIDPSSRDFCSKASFTESEILRIILNDGFEENYA